MSKESYARGFCKAAEAAGVDPVALAKYAQVFGTSGSINTMAGGIRDQLSRLKTPTGAEDAGIGRHIDNSDRGVGDGGKYIPYNPTSYAGRLFARHPGEGNGVLTPLISSSAWPENMKQRFVSLKDLERSRRWQAATNATYLYPEGSAPYKRVYDNLMNAGRENHKSYLETGDTKERTAPNLQGIEKLKLTPEQKNQLLQMQNTMASKGVPRTGNIA